MVIKVWQRNDRSYPYIPASFINTQKVYSFEETTATFNACDFAQRAPKIRVLHGSERVKLSSEDQAYPYLFIRSCRWLYMVIDTSSH